jgi:hypothetical protein
MKNKKTKGFAVEAFFFYHNILSSEFPPPPRTKIDKMKDFVSSIHFETCNF